MRLQQTAYLYLLRLPSTRYFKIGVSKAPLHRVGRLRQTGSIGAQLINTFQYANAYGHERYWHAHFRPQRRTLAGACEGQTEWFELNEWDLFLFEQCNALQQALTARTAANRACSELSHLFEAMNKKEVAEALNVSTRLVERYAKEGRLGAVTYVRGKTGKQAEYDPAAVDRLRVELESVDRPIATNSPESGLVGPNVSFLEQQRTANVQQGEQVLGLLASIDKRLLALAEHGTIEHNGKPAIDPEALTATLAQAVTEAATRAEQTRTEALAHKLTLSLAEASQLAGLSRGHLREAIEEKRLKARIIGKGWRVKRADLEAYVTKL